MGHKMTPRRISTQRAPSFVSSKKWILNNIGDSNVAMLWKTATAVGRGKRHAILWALARFGGPECAYNSTGYFYIGQFNVRKHWGLIQRNSTRHLFYNFDLKQLRVLHKEGRTTTHWYRSAAAKSSST